jgi:hypothetical protein
MRAIVGSFVGFLVGKSWLPDMDEMSGINPLHCICRKCRVLSGVETSRGSE